MIVIQERRRAAEALRSEQFFTVKLAVFPAKLNVAFVGQVAESVVYHLTIWFGFPRGEARAQRAFW
jgi:hypothetical protein